MNVFWDYPWLPFMTDAISTTTGIFGTNPKLGICKTAGEYAFDFLSFSEIHNIFLFFFFFFYSTKKNPFHMERIVKNVYWIFCISEN